MAEVQPPLFSQHVDPAQPIEHPAVLWRQHVDGLLDYHPGIVAPDHLEVVQNPTPNMTVIVTDGVAYVRGTSDPDQGMYWVRSDADVSVAIPTADATNLRKDLVVAQVYDGGYDGGDQFSWALEVVQGAADGLEEEPETPDSCLVLAVVTVPAQAEAITTGDIEDRRTGQPGQTQAAALGGVIRCEDTNKPDPHPGRLIYNLESKLLEIGDGTQYNGLAAVSNPAYVVVGRGVSETQTLDHNTWTPIQWSVAVENPFGMWAADPVPDRLTFSLPGLYLVECVIHFADNATGDRGLRFLLDGVNPRGRVMYRAAGGGSTLTTSISLTRMVRTTPGAWITVGAYQSSGGQLDLVGVDGEGPRVSVTLVRR